MPFLDACQFVRQGFRAPGDETAASAVLDFGSQGAQPLPLLCRGVINGITGIIPVRIIVGIFAPVPFPYPIDGAGGEAL